jgi:hypothetical protein
MTMEENTTEMKKLGYIWDEEKEDYAYGGKEPSKIRGKDIEYFKERDRKGYLNQREKRLKYAKMYNRLHREEKTKQQKERYKLNRVKILSYFSNRHRKLGFKVVWEPEIIIEPMEYHHINLNEVVLVPKKIHHSIWHNVFTGKGMDEINALIFEYIASQSQPLYSCKTSCM